MTDPQKQRQVQYSPPGPIVAEFLNDPSFVRGIMGPLGSGKSTACVIEILKRAQEQAPASDGIPYTRWAIIRNTYPELKTTTIKTWGEWCPTTFGKFTQDSPITHHIKTPDLDIEVFFIALDQPDDVRKLLSLELTGAWINEAREIPKDIVDALTGRVGRYPSKIKGGATWSGIIMDTNPPDDQSWWYKFAEEETPKGWKFFKQPAGDSEGAENLENLPNGYYDRIKQGKDEDWIKVYVKSEYGYVTEGKPVFPMFRDSVHVSPVPIPANRAFPLMIGADFGLTPAAVIAQHLPDGRWHIIDEFITENCGIIRFAEGLAKYVAEFYPEHVSYTLNGKEIDESVVGFGDPAGNARGTNDEKTALEIMREYTGWKWRPAPTNDLTMRKEAVIAPLNRLVDGKPGMLISPKCKDIRKGFAGGYHYASIRSANGARFHETPAKNKYSHPHDGLQYVVLGGGEHKIVMRKQKRKATNGPQVAKDLDYDIFGG